MDYGKIIVCSWRQLVKIVTVIDEIVVRLARLGAVLLLLRRRRLLLLLLVATS